MEVPVVNMQGQKVQTVELPEQVFGVMPNIDLMHQAFVRQMANARLGTHKTKTRGEVAGGGKKPWRQKGTGRARQGSTRAVQWVGGGRVHTPQPRDYTLRMPLKMRHAALCSALSVKAAEKGIVVVDQLILAEAKTRVVAQTLQSLIGSDSVLILAAEKNEQYESWMNSTNNLPGAKLLLASYVNIRDLLNYDKLILPLEALSVLVTQLG